MTTPRFTSIQVGGLVLAAVFIVGGFICATRPTDILVGHQDPETTKIDWEYVTKSRTRVYGITSIIFGTGIAIFVLYPRQRWREEGD